MAVTENNYLPLSRKFKIIFRVR